MYAMSAWEAFKLGTHRIWVQKRMVFWLYLVNVAFAAVLVYPFREVVRGVAATDLAVEFRNGFSGDAFVDVWRSHGPQLKSLVFAALGLGLLYVLVTVFVTGGIVTGLASERRTSVRRFLRNAGQLFGRNLRLFVFQWIAIALCVVGYLFALKPWIDEWRENATTDRGSLLWQALGVCVVLFVMSFVWMVFDYARIRLGSVRRRSAIRAALASLGFCLRRLPKTLAIFYLNFGLVAGLFLAYVLVEWQFSNATIASTLGLFTIQQLFVLGRIWMRLSFYASQIAYFFAVTAAPAPAPLRVPLRVPPPTTPIRPPPTVTG